VLWVTSRTPRVLSGGDHGDVIDVFAGICDGVAAVLAQTTDWGASGLKPDQYSVDLAADQVCTEGLYDAGFAVLSEESGITLPPGGPADAPVVVVDPLDGSTNASRGIPWFATALCLVEHDPETAALVPTAAMVANHATGERHWAVRGEGAFRDGAPIRVSGCRELSECMLGVNGLPDRHYGWAQFRAMGAAAPDLCSVASGVLDAWCDMTSAGHGVWDYLASVLICQEAGAHLAEVNGDDLVILDIEQRRIPVVAATPELLEAVIERRRSRPAGR
jgi:myo-inositol-1(or 4)-monophosphatase